MVIFREPGVCLVSFFFSSIRRHTRCYRYWSSDVCSSDLTARRLRTAITLQKSFLKNVLPVTNRERRGFFRWSHIMMRSEEQRCLRKLPVRKQCHPGPLI